MATAPVSPCAAVTARAAQVQLMIFDVDGVLTDGRLTIAKPGRWFCLSMCTTGKASNYWRGRACRLHSLRAAHRQLSLRARASLASNARPEVRACAHWVTQATGGHGAAREVCDLLLRAQHGCDTLPAEGGSDSSCSARH